MIYMALHSLRGKCFMKAEELRVFSAGAPTQITMKNNDYVTFGAITQSKESNHRNLNFKVKYFFSFKSLVYLSF